VTKKTPAVLAAVATLDTAAGARLMDHVLQRGTVELEALRRAHRRTTGRHGATRCAELLRLAAGGARSQAERLAHQALTVAAITGWCADRPVWLPGYGQALLDLAFDELRVLVEIDGWAYHRDLRSFLRDADRQNALVLQGWVVIRTNWYELTENVDQFLAHVLEPSPTDGASPGSELRRRVLASHGHVAAEVPASSGSRTWHSRALHGRLIDRDRLRSPSRGPSPRRLRPSLQLRLSVLLTPARPRPASSS
jgi:very-short-patch-repair endonuclease